MTKKGGKKKREKNLIPLNKRSQRKRKEIAAMGGKATKGIPKPSLWRCKTCRYLKDGTCLIGPVLIKKAKKGVNPKCAVPIAKRIILESALEPMGLLRLTKHLLSNAAFEAEGVDENVKVALANLKLAAHISPPVQKHAVLTSDIQLNEALTVIYEVLMRQKRWQAAIPHIKKEFEKKWGKAT